MLLEILTICSLVSVSPFYDCSDKWEIRVYSELPEIQCNDNDVYYVKLACANIKRDVIHMVNAPDFRDEFGQTILQHELKHLSCKCDFH